MTDTSKTPSKGAMIAAGAIMTGCAIGLMTFAEASEIIERETHAGEMEKLLRELSKQATSYANISRFRAEDLRPEAVRPLRNAIAEAERLLKELES